MSLVVDSHSLRWALPVCFLYLLELLLPSGRFVPCGMADAFDVTFFGRREYKCRSQCPVFRSSFAAPFLHDLEMRRCIFRDAATISYLDCAVTPSFFVTMVVVLTANVLGWQSCTGPLFLLLC